MAVATLAELLAPVPEAEFAERLQRRELTVWRGGDPARLRTLLDWTALERLLAAGTFPASRMRMTRGGTPIHEAFFTQDGRPDDRRIRKLLDEGASLILSPFEGSLSAVDALLANIRTSTPDRLDSGVIVSTGAGGAFERHYDPDDILVVQLEGTKVWRVHETPVPNPVRKMPAVPPPSGGRILEETLAPGDVMLVPAGYWHQCENGAGRSIHLGIFFVPLSLAMAAGHLWRRLLADERARAPLSRGDAGALDEAVIRSRLIDEVLRMSKADFFGEDA